MELESGHFLLLQIDMMAFKMRSSNVSSAITDSIEFELVDPKLAII